MAWAPPPPDRPPLPPPDPLELCEKNGDENEGIDIQVMDLMVKYLKFSCSVGSKQEPTQWFHYILYIPTQMI